MKRFLSTILMLLVACQSTEGHSRRINHYHSNAVQMTVVDGNGYALPSYFSKGKSYVQGEYGDRYQIKVRNPYATRIEVVITVDGRDVINGQKGSFSNRGYVLDPYQEALIDGFRQSDSQVATFRFTTPSDSYSSRMGTAENVGVIGMAVFAEKQAEVIHYPTEPYVVNGVDEPSAEAAKPSMSDSVGAGQPVDAGKARKSGMRETRSEAKSNLGTQYGESRYSHTQKTDFERRTAQPIQVSSLFYDNEAGLIRRGVLIKQVTPSAFPQEPQYAPPPP